MTSKVDEKIDELLDIQGEIVEVEKRLPTLSKGNYSKHEEQESDYKYSREVFYGLVERGQDAIEGILDIARESEHPRVYEVAGQLIKTVGETTEKLIDLQAKVKELDKDDIKLPPFSINGQGTFPSVLWARSMHISRSFPRSLIDEEGVWWQGRKKYQPPSESVEAEPISKQVALDTRKDTDNSATSTNDSTTVLSVRLGGYRAYHNFINRSIQRRRV